MTEGWIKIIDEHVIRVSRESLADTLVASITDTREVVLVCILKGASYFTIDLSRDLERRNFKHTIYFVEASSYKGQEQGETVELLSKLVPAKLDGKHIILLDELYDNGKTMDTIRKHLVEQELDCVISTCVMFKKRGKTPLYPLPDYIGLDVPNVWIVGYGLDNDGYHRGLMDLWAKRKPQGIEWTSDDWRIFINKVD